MGVRNMSYTSTFNFIRGMSTSNFNIDWKFDKPKKSGAIPKTGKRKNPIYNVRLDMRNKRER